MSLSNTYIHIYINLHPVYSKNQQLKASMSDDGPPDSGPSSPRNDPPSDNGPLDEGDNSEGDIPGPTAQEMEQHEQRRQLFAARASALQNNTHRSLFDQQQRELENERRQVFYSQGPPPRQSFNPAPAYEEDEDTQVMLALEASIESERERTTKKPAPLIDLAAEGTAEGEPCVLLPPPSPSFG